MEELQETNLKPNLHQRARLGWAEETTSEGIPSNKNVTTTSEVTTQNGYQDLAEISDLFTRDNTDEYPIDERPQSAGSSSVSSRSSKRTSISNDLSANIRQRIRQQATAKIAEKRGSVQLAKRLLRSQTLQTAPDEVGTEEDHEVVDRQIQASIQLGEKYTQASGQSRAAPEHLQKSFFESLTIQSVKSPDTSTHVIFGKTKLVRPSDTEKFGHLITSYGRKALSTSIEDPIAKIDNKFFASKPARDYSILAQRVGHTFLNSNGTVKGLEDFLTNKPLKLDRDEDEDFLLVEYSKAQNWDEWEKQKGRHPSRYFQFNIDVNRVEFDHHWLFSTEDSLAREVRNLHQEFEECGQRAVECMQQFLRLQQRKESQIVNEEEEEKRNKEMEQIETEFEEAFSTYRKLASLLEVSWQKLVEHRENQPTPTITRLLLEKAESSLPEDFGDIHHRFQSFVTYPTYLLKETQPIENKKLEKIEVERQIGIKKVRIQIQIFFNDILVCKTQPLPLSNDFIVKCSNIYNLRVFEKPENVTLVILERFGRFGWRELARVFVPVPIEMDNHPWDSTRLECMQFASSLQMDKYKGSMGSGILGVVPFIQGKLYCKSTWVDSEFKHSDCDKKPEVQEGEIFELIPHETRLISDEEFASDVRLEALSKRFSIQYRNKHPGKWIGLNSDEVDHGWLSDDFRWEERTQPGSLNFSTIDVYRRAGNRYAAMIRNHLIEMYARDRRMKNYNDIVNEPSLPTSLFDIGSLFGPPDLSRRLKPMRVTAQRTQGQVKAQYHVIVNIQSAINLPERNNGNQTHAFVEVIFQKQSGQTQVIEGKNANWQQTISLNLINSNIDEHLDFKRITDCLQLNVYDQVVSQLESDDREPNTIHEQIQKRWLGSVTIPFSTIFSLGKIDGILAIKLPLFFTGYKIATEHAFIKAMITIDPPIAPPHFSSYDNFLVSESDLITKSCMKWEKHCRTLFPERRFVGLVNDANGKRVLVTRFLRGIRPPRHILAISENREQAIDLATYLVSCIPFVADPVMFPGVLDLWTTVEQMLTIGCGDEEEHAILLTCWLLYLGISAVLLLGAALPEGPKAAYVLVQLDNNVCWLINPTDGNKYALNEPMCPLISLGTLVTPENVYANIQRAAHPSQLDFDLKKITNWLPLFSENRTDLTSIQVESIEYSDVREDAVVELRTNLEREIKLKFDEMRPYGIPQWNLMASREVLTNISNAVNVDIESVFLQLRDSYTISAVALRRPYISKENLLEDIRNLNVHVNSDQNVQFALALHIQPFVNNIISCAVAMASLTPKI